MNPHGRNPHLSLETIWKFAKFQTKPAAPEFNHMINCDECVSVLGLCQMYDSISKVQQRLNERSDQQTSAAR
jgi:hypothetical protein